MRTPLLATVMTASFGLGVLQAAEQERDIADATARAVARAEQAPPAVTPVEQLVYDAAPAAAGPTLIPTGKPAAGMAQPPIDPMNASPLTAQPESFLSGPSDPTDAREMLRQAAMSAELRVRVCTLALSQTQDPDLASLARAELQTAAADRAAVRDVAEAHDFSLSAHAFDAWHAAQVTRLRQAGPIDEFALRAVLSDARGNEHRYLAAYAQEGEVETLRVFAERRADELSRIDYASYAAATTG